MGLDEKMKLKEVIQQSCGIRYMVDALDIQSSVARRMLLEQEMMTRNEDIEREYAILKKYVSAFRDVRNQQTVKTLQFRLQGLKDIRTTLQNLQEGRTLDDIELFEVKHLALLAEEVREQMQRLELACDWAETEEVVKILDPDGLHIATFYVYDAYSEVLRTLRKQLEQHPNDEKLFAQVQEEENRVRVGLTQQLQKYTGVLGEALLKLAQIDIRTAKALQIIQVGLSFPTLCEHTNLQEMWNPEVEAALQQRGKEYQRNSLQLTACPTILTGANMGGKTIVLKTVALCQYLLQLGMGIPAQQAEMQVFEQIKCCMVDGQSVESGLSSFAAEIKQLNEIILTARKQTKTLALIDEPARTTNPKEGTALVSALIEILKETGCTSLVVTHYNINAHACPCLRARGMENGKMNYLLEVAKEGEVPHEAIQIAEQLGVDSLWLQKAKAAL